MDFIILAVFCALTAICGFFCSVRQFQMLQQNSYFAVRYLKWYKGSFSVKRAVYFVFCLSLATGVYFAFSFDLTLRAVILAFALIWLFFCAVRSVKLNKTSVKKLVITARVRRMFACLCALFFAVFSASLLLPQFVCLSAVLFILAALPEILTLISLFIMKPIEKAISNHYVRDAKKILRSMKHLKVIGVTGSYGKTSTKFILGRILSERYNTLVTPENYNTPMGLVITVRRDLKPQTEIFIAEMGAKRKGDILEDCKIADPDLGIITSVGPQHLDTFHNIQTVISTKFELADWVKAKNGKMFLNSDNGYINKKKDEYDSVTYGLKAGDCTAADIEYSPKGLTLTINYKEHSFKVTSHLLGAYNAQNICAASAVALELGLTPQEIAFAVSKLKPIEHRLQLKPYINGATLIDDAYNSNPEGCLEAVKVLGSFEGMRKIIVTPGLVELGDKEYEANRRLGEKAAENCDVLILVGKKRSIPLAEGARAKGFNEENLYIVGSFKEAVTVFSPMCNSNTAILFENDLPDNYLE